MDWSLQLPVVPWRKRAPGRDPGHPHVYFESISVQTSRMSPLK